MWVIRERHRTGLRATAPIRAVALFLLLALTDLPAAAQDDPSAVREILATGAPPVTDIDAALGAEALAELRRVYTARDDRPIWLGSPAAGALLERLSAPDMTIGPKLRPLLGDARTRIAAADPQTRAGADLLLTALYGATAQALRPNGPSGFAAALAELTASNDLASLLREPEAPKAEVPPVETPPVETPKVETSPAPATPPEAPTIARLRAAIAALQPQADKGWPQVADGPKLQLGDTGPRVDALRARLVASGDLTARTSGAFDLMLQSALEHFQARHGLPSDGVAGTVTIAALNVPLKDRLASMTANLQRLEREGRDWGDRYLVLNIPAATYRRVEGGRTVAEGPAILGTPATPTPLINSRIDRVLLHPAWHIPQQYADRYLWPRQEEDALYFVNHGIRVTDDGLRQVPGRNNPLGPVKLLIAGNDRIALHGSPDQSALESPARFTSLGCAVLADVAPIAKALLAADPAWPEGRIDMLAVGGTETVTLAKPLPVHVVYETAWVDEDGTIQFRDDIYGWDKQMPATDPNSVADPCGS